MSRPCVLITIIDAKGSTPREQGAKMLVTSAGIKGTIGGGTLEWHALAAAQAMLGKGPAQKTLTKNLGPDLGQCCGGRVTLKLECFDELVAIEQDEPTHLNLWGAGHVGKALVLALAPLPFTVTWWDERPGAFPTHVPQNVTCRQGHPEDMDDGLVLVMTHSHALDFTIVDYALRSPAFAQVGLIGSDTKRARFIKRLAETGHGQENLERFTCPIGSKSIRSKLPASIAASVAVQLLEWQQLLKTNKNSADLPLNPAKAK